MTYYITIKNTVMFSVTLIEKIKGNDQYNNDIVTNVIKEKSLTIFLNSQEIVTLMCIGDHPKYLAIG